MTSGDAALLMREAIPHHKAIVLVVEDDAIVRMSALDMVAEAGFQAISAANTDEAICVLETRNDVSAVFTDVQMPGSIDGLRFASIVRSRWPTIALIVTSGRTRLPDTEIPGGGRFLAKPYGIAQIQAVLCELLGAQ